MHTHTHTDTLQPPPTHQKTKRKYESKPQEFNNKTQMERSTDVYKTQFLFPIQLESSHQFWGFPKITELVSSSQAN